MPGRSLMLNRYVPPLLTAVFACYGAAVARSQSSNMPYPSGTGVSASSSNSGRLSTNPNGSRGLDNDLQTFDPNLAHRQVVSRREDLKRRMVENAGRLLMLTRDLETDLQTREANEADGKRLDEIAKLARTVRDQMRQ